MPVPARLQLLRQPSQPNGFTLIELMVATSVLLILSAVGLRSMFVFSEQRKLRTAAVELSGYLQVARNAARAENGPCTLALNPTRDTLAPAGSASNICKAGSVLPDVKLRANTGSRDVTVAFDSGAQSITFNPEGTITTGDTLLLSSANVPDGVWCVAVDAPLATVRMGWRGTGQSTCNFANEQ